MIYVMSDIHGNLRRFNSILEQIKLTDKDTLYVLGDVIDRYPDGIRILRKLMAMDNVKMTIGNHEDMMLKSLYTNTIGLSAKEQFKHEQMVRLWYDNGGRVTHNYLKHIRKTLRTEIFTYLESLPVSYDITVNGKDYKLVHAAPEEMFDEYYKLRYTESREFAVWHRIKGRDIIPGNYTLIFGHTPTVYFQYTIPLRIYHKVRYICIDCGAGTAEAPGTFSGFCYGRLACLRLDDMKEFYSEEDYKENEQQN